MWNLTTRVATPYAIETAPPDEYVVGKSAEWILETPAYNNTPGVLAQYGEVYFDQCVAATRDHAILLGGQGELLSQSDVSGQIISTPNVLTDELITIRYTASP
jgi:Peptidase A4 family